MEACARAPPSLRHLVSAQDFQSISPKFSQMLCAEAVPQGSAVYAVRQEPSGARRDQSGPGHALVWPSCSPSLALCCQHFGLFPPAKGENKARRQLLLQGMPAAGAVLASQGLKSYREGGQAGAHCAPVQAAATPWLPKKPIRQISTQASTRWEGGGRQALPRRHKSADSHSGE